MKPVTDTSELEMRLGGLHHITMITVGAEGAGSVHHSGFVTGVRDRDYFESIYFREPRGRLERSLTPVVNPRTAARAGEAAG